MSHSLEEFAELLHSPFSSSSSLCSLSSSLCHDAWPVLNPLLLFIIAINLLTDSDDDEDDHSLFLTSGPYYGHGADRY